MTPREHYQQDLSKRNFLPAPSQEAALDRLDALHQQLIATKRHTPSLLNRLLKRPAHTVRGLYIWGGVGRGKTYLMDHFYDALPFNEKRRVHFHRFMQEIHAELKTLPKTSEPLTIIAKRLAEKTRVLCLDEFHVNDIGDAMLLAGFLEALFGNGVTLVTTSNIPADELYKNGLQRQRFVPAIELIKTHTEMFHLDGDKDYRTELLEKTGTYHISNEQTNELLQQQFAALAPDKIEKNGSLHINNRNINTIAISDDVVWLDFKSICETPRSSADYMEIAREFHTVIISQLPILNESKDDVTQRFIHLIDALYDHNVKVIFSAATKPSELYTGKRHAFVFKRTISRLQEMASEQYLTKAHRA